jgi:hypothetical protein
MGMPRCCTSAHTSRACGHTQVRIELDMAMHCTALHAALVHSSAGSAEVGILPAGSVSAAAQDVIAQCCCTVTVQLPSAAVASHVSRTLSTLLLSPAAAAGACRQARCSRLVAVKARATQSTSHCLVRGSSHRLVLARAITHCVGSSM